MKKLPEKLSALIEVALVDLAAVRADPRYVIDLGIYHHKPSATEPCSVCLAGAVMAGTLGADIVRDLGPYNFGETARDQLHALNHVRVGRVEDAEQFVHPRGGFDSVAAHVETKYRDKFPEGRTRFDNYDLQDGRTYNRFVRQMNWLIAELKKVGL